MAEGGARPGAGRSPAGAPIAPLLFCLLLATGPAAAQGMGLSGVSDDKPVEISADSGIEWRQDAQEYIARGNAVAKRGTSEVHADTLTAHYRPSKSKTADGGNEIYRLDADGHVVIKGETQNIVGDQAVYDVDQQIAIVTGKGLKLTTQKDTVTARDSLEWYDQQQIAVARGDAVAVQEEKRIRADVLTAHMTKDKPGPADAKAPAKPAAVPAKAPARRRRRRRLSRRKGRRRDRSALRRVRRGSAASTPRAMSSSRPRPTSPAAIMASITPTPGSPPSSATSR